MTSDRGQLIEELFHRALECPPEERNQFLASACKNDPELLEEVRPLVEAHESATDFLAKPVTDSLGLASADGIDSGIIREVEESLVGQRIKAWRLVERIASGGMGAVYAAERDDGEYRQKAAIKLLRPGLRFDEPRYRNKLIRQFREEQHHLAALDHPNIAKLLDSGTTEQGLPYLVMEYIDGPPLTEYCEGHDLPIRQRLSLFRNVCLALQHAHGKLIAHRDIKPSNILVMPPPGPGLLPVPKLLDFGIAKLLKSDEFDLRPKTTLAGLRPMTLEYASPEQVRGETTSTLSDIYSLGVVLYELVTGKLPYDVTRYSAEWIIGEQRPRRPSSVRRGLSREIDAIIMKAMAKNPADRYQSAASFAEDIDRYLSGRVILAHPPSALYHIGKFISRNRRGIIAGALIAALSISSGAWIGTMMKHNAELDARDRERTFASQAFFVARSLVNKGLGWEAEMLLKQVIDIEESAPQDMARGGPLLLAERRELLGRSLLLQGRYKEAEKSLKQSYDIFERLAAQVPAMETRVLRSRLLMYQLYTGLGQATKAAEYQLTSEELAQLMPPPEQPMVARPAFLYDEAPSLSFMSKGNVGPSIPAR